MENNSSKAYVDQTGLTASALAPSGEAGSPLFVINLCASMAPVQTNGKTLPGLEAYRLYQVARAEDGRTRHRLRLGFFVSEAQANEVLAQVRDKYPTAFTACLCEEDRRYTRGYALPEAASMPTPAQKPPMTIVKNTPVKPAAAAAPVKPAAVRPAAAKPSPSVTAPKPAPASSPTIELSLEPSPVKPAGPAIQSTQKPNGAKHGASIIDLDDLSWEPPALDAKAPPAKNGAATSPAAIPASFKTQPVIKSEPAKPHVPINKAVPKAPASTAPGKPAAPAAHPIAKADSGASMRVKALELTLSDPPPPPASSARATSNEPFHVGKGVNIPAMQLSLETDGGAKGNTSSKPSSPSAPARAPLPGIAKPVVAKPVATKSAVAATTPAPATAKSANTVHGTVAKPPAAATKHPDLDSTQTIRALTSAELHDEAQEKCFAIQLAASEQPVNLDTMPHLDIFEAYRLYSVAIAGSGKIVHSLRLGFFKEAVSAEAVAGYLKTFFSSPTVLRISVAEQARFKDATVPKRSEPTAAKPNVVELNDARASRAPVPTVTMEVPPKKLDTSATGSFKLNATGSFRTSETAKHRALGGSAKPAAKAASPATKRSPPMARSKTSTSGKFKYKAPQRKSLNEQLLEEAHEVELSASGIRKLPKNDSLLARLVDKLKN